MPIAVDLNSFCESAILPEGFEFYDYGGVHFSRPVPVGDSWLNDDMIAVERVSDRKSIAIKAEKVSVRGNRLLVDASKLCAAIDKAILELS